MKKRFFISSAKFFALICVLTLSVGTVKATDWISIASTPTTGDFYIFNLQKGMFLYYNQWENKFQVTADPNEVTLFSLTVGETYSTISCSFYDWGTEQDVTKYMAKVNTDVAPSDDPFNLKIEASNTQEGASRIWIWNKPSGLGKGDKYLDVYNSLTNNDVYYNKLPGWGTNWIFITEENFSTLEPPHHYAQIQYPGDDDKHGAYAVVDYDANWNPIYEYHYTLPNTDLEVVNFKESYTHQFNEVQAMPARGYQFVSWSLMGANAEYSVNPYWDVTYTATTNPTQINVTSTSDDAESPEVAIIKPTFEALAPLNMTLRKAANRGSVAVQYQNYFDNDAHDGLEYKTINCDGLTSANTEKSYTVYSSDVVTVTAQPVLGYNFYGWYSVNSTTGEKTLVSEDAEFTFQPSDDEIYYAYFNTPVTAADKFKVGFSLCQTFEQALAAVNETDNTILQVNDYTIPAGDYTIPAGVTLVIPRDANQKSSISPMREGNNNTPTTAYKVLTLASGATLNVLGEIEVGGSQNTAGTGNTGTGRPNGSTYGQIVMQSGSKIILNSGANLRAWGFVTGEGEIDVRRGARVDEMFQLYDFKGGSLTYAMLDNAGKVFPMNQYYIQNIEVPTKYRPGAALYGAMAAVDMGINVKIIGVETDGAALFKMANKDDSEDTWVRKSYDASSDQQVYEINNKAALSNLEMDFGLYGTFNSSAYTLPITNNMKIHLLSGELEVTQSTVMLPGSEMEVDKLATINVLTGKNLYLYDADEWTACVYDNVFASKIKCRPGGVPNVRDISSAAGLGDAKINIHGTLVVNGALYTTESGANIYSSNSDAGTIKFEKDAPAENSTLAHPSEYIYVGGFDSEVNYATKVVTPAQLKNETGSTYRETASTAAGTSYCYIQGAWRDLEQEDDCLVKDGTTYFAKPQDYVELKSGTEDENHLYYSADETRTFITTLDGDGNCQWWEVEPVEGGLMHCIHPNNDVYYFYDEDSESDTYETWQEKRFNVTFKNWDGTKLTFINTESQVQDHYELRYGSMPQWYGSNPTRDTDPRYYTYDFIGWYPVLSPVTADVEYTAQYEKKPVLYAITFNDADGNLIEVTYCRRDEMPVCQRHTLADGEHWEPALGLVTGAQAYQLSTTTKTDNFTIKFVNWDGDVLHTAENVPNTTDAAGVAALYTGTPEKAGLGSEEEYTFAGWTPEITAATADAVYTATFTVKTIAPLTIINQQTIADEREVSELIVTTSGTLNVTGSVTATNFILESNGSTASGQLLGAENITATNAYFDLKLNAQNHNWYAVAVPWQVDATNGISVNGRTLVLGKDFDIIYYSGERRASEGKNKCWNYVEDDGDKTLYPGRLYMIGLMGDASTIRFAKKAGANLLTTTTSVTEYPQTTGDTQDANWNGVANPALFHAFVNPGATAGQIYNSANKSYEPFLLNEKKLVVGQGVYVQAPAYKDITVTYGGAYAAPRRARADVNALYDVRIAPAKAAYTDRLFVQIDEEKETESYVIGQDLSKVGVSKKVAQMWINRYNTELCMNTIAPVNGVAEYPLGISVPANGEYTLSLAAQPDDEYTVYLTLNGEAIWNLSDGAYTLNLAAGTNKSYGLRLSARKSPSVATGVDEAVVDAQGETKKVIINDKVFIIRGENVYTIDGQLVK